MISLKNMLVWAVQKVLFFILFYDYKIIYLILQYSALYRQPVMRIAFSGVVKTYCIITD